ncbi:unnamed protein product, partial [Parascedosporium putredinis]
MMSTEPVP